MTKKPATKARGRPRAFDETEALIAAMRVFAQKGFEAASLTALTKAMKINRVSMYATFGNKEELFRKAIDLYSRIGAELLAGCLAADTARVGVDRLLRKGVTMFTDPAGVGVCFVTQAPLTGPDASEDTRRYVAKKRAAIELALRDRFDRAIEAGELPLTVSAPDLARFYSVVIQGIALQAQHGGTQEQLFGVVDMVMESWPVRSRKRR